MSDYVIWKNVQRKNETCLRDFKGLDKTFPLLVGRSLKDTFPDNVTFSMDADEPNRMLLTDSPTNTSLVVVGSERLAKFFQDNNVPAVEYLPVAILNHKEKPIKEPYFILHPIDPIDCLNLQGVKVQYSKILPDKINRLDRVVLFEDNIPPEIVYFRCKALDLIIVVKRTFAEALSATGFTGFEWKELEEFR